MNELNESISIYFTKPIRFFSNIFLTLAKSITNESLLHWVSNKKKQKPSGSGGSGISHMAAILNP